MFCLQRVFNTLQQHTQNQKVTRIALTIVPIGAADRVEPYLQRQIIYQGGRCHRTASCAEEHQMHCQASAAHHTVLQECAPPPPLLPMENVNKKNMRI